MKNFIYAGVGSDEIVTDVLRDEVLPLVEPGWTVLDIGMSAGHAISPFAFKGLNIFGVDKNRGALDFSHREFETAGIGDQLTTTAMDAMQFLDTNTRLFEVVSMTDFLMFSTKTKAIEFIKSAHKATMPNGLIWIISKSANDGLYYRMSVGERVDVDTYIVQSGCGGPSTLCFFWPGEIDALLQELGAKILYSDENVNRVGSVVNTVLARKLA